LRAPECASLVRFPIALPYCALSPIALSSRNLITALVTPLKAGGLNDYHCSIHES
jgi:hypothetical protein